MALFKNLQTWWQEKTGEEETPFDGDSSAFFVSLLFHMLLLIVMGLVPFVFESPNVSLTIAAPLKEEFEEPKLMPEDFASSPLVAEEIGANSVGDVGMAMSLAQIVSDVSVVPSFTDLPVEPTGDMEVNLEISVATGLNFSKNLTVRGATGEGVTGATGAIDRLTEEILRSLEERKTLVVWLFDQSPSLSRERAAINERFDRIYEELGVIEAAGNPAFSKHEDKPLLTSVMAFGQEVKLLTKQPTDDLQEIKAAVAAIPQDSSGIEKIFSSVYLAAERFKSFRIRDPAKNEPERNVMLIAFTDERGDDLDGMDTTISMCRRYAIPVYVVGVPAPFGQEETFVKWIDPDPKFDQTAQWGRVNQGPETLFPERIKFGFGGEGEGPDPMDSGFGPFALTRMCYETGGIYFSVHPSRNVHREVSRDETPELTAHLKYFFDPQIMRRYRPDYVPAEEYLKRAETNRAARRCCWRPRSRGSRRWTSRCCGSSAAAGRRRPTRWARLRKSASRRNRRCWICTTCSRRVRRTGRGRRPRAGRPATTWPWDACWRRWSAPGVQRAVGRGQPRDGFPGRQQQHLGLSARGRHLIRQPSGRHGGQSQGVSAGGDQLSSRNALGIAGQTRTRDPLGLGVDRRVHGLIAASRRRPGRPGRGLRRRAAGHRAQAT